MITTSIQKINNSLSTALRTTADCTLSKVTKLANFIFESESIGLNFIREHPYISAIGTGLLITSTSLHTGLAIIIYLLILTRISEFVSEGVINDSKLKHLNTSKEILSTPLYNELIAFDRIIQRNGANLRERERTLSLVVNDMIHKYVLKIQKIDKEIQDIKKKSNIITTSIQKINNSLSTTLRTTADCTLPKVTKLANFIFESESIGLNFIRKHPYISAIGTGLLIGSTPLPYTGLVAIIIGLPTFAIIAVVESTRVLNNSLRGLLNEKKQQLYNEMNPVLAAWDANNSHDESSTRIFIETIHDFALKIKDDTRDALETTSLSTSSTCSYETT